MLCIITLHACQVKNSRSVSVQGHRGDRGNWPENTLEAFKSAVDKGVDVLELDVVINKYDEVIVSHEPFMHSDYVLLPKGEAIKPENQRSWNIYHMRLDSIQTFDTGSKIHKGFPNQRKLPTYKPSLEEVFLFLEKEYGKEIFSRIAFNIELKSNPKEYGKYQAYPENMTAVFFKFMAKYKYVEYILQSFDINILENAKIKKPNLPISYLVSQGSLLDNLKKLTFKPDIYSPNFKLLTSELEVKEIQNHSIKVIPWTVNEEYDIKQLINWGVDGIISDYPERVLKLR